MAVVAVMSVQPTSENFTVLQLAGSAAKAAEAHPNATLASTMTCDTFIVGPPLVVVFLFLGVLLGVVAPEF